MSAQRFEIEYGPSALNDLDVLPARERAHILARLSGCNKGLTATSIACTMPKLPIDCEWATTESCSTWKMPLSLSARLAIAKMSMTKTAEKDLIRSIDRKREQIAALREELETMNDYLNLAEARVRNEGKPRLSQAEVRKRYGLK